jgi:hypothetical protein
VRSEARFSLPRGEVELPGDRREMSARTVERSPAFSVHQRSIVK